MQVETIVVQTMVRGALQRPKYRQALIDKKEEATLENQLRALQRKLEEAEAKRGSRIGKTSRRESSGRPSTIQGSSGRRRTMKKRLFCRNVYV
jgi:hypothetical protein